VLKEALGNIAAHDRHMAQLLAHGSWTPIFVKNSFAALVNHELKKTLIIWKARVKGIGLTIRYNVYDGIYSEESVREKYRKIMGKDLTYSKSINLKKYNKGLARAKHNRKPTDGAEIIKRQIEIIEDIKRSPLYKSEPHGEKVRLGKRLAKLKRKLQETTIEL